MLVYILANTCISIRFKFNVLHI